ncbi:hypothetical protein PPYR_01635 [Photinus pyralis]|uniref:Lipase domain-containing protein n=2 Tax=Photinus pyralis TaxID=7054 RepID=A0A5N4B4Y5_PHOPY|nr:phospholipase A1-like [Photinus pyralis]KAB0804665.1 hypothetical protein PPYR_01635 [Photinus pyralis]
MKGAILLALACLSVAAASQDRQMMLLDLPKDILGELMALLKGQKVVKSIQCTDPKPNDIELLLYTRHQKYDPVVLDVFAPSPIKSDKPVIFITHGWLQDIKDPQLQDLKNAYLERYDSDVVMVNWGKLAWDLYARTACKVPKIAQIIADYLCQVNYEKGMPLENVQLVGHSIGAHLAGFVGQFTQQMCNKRVGRITGLDPAGPLFNDAPTAERLDKSDADFVDIIHTNSKTFGYSDPIGHADFYASCGTFQSSCVIPDFKLDKLINMPMDAVFCSHRRSVDYMIESVLSSNFVATECKYCPIGCPPVIALVTRPGKAILGQQCSPDTRGKYYVPTNLKSPYATGGRI